MQRSDHLRSQADVLEANENFYRAFTNGDLDAMSKLWARRSPVACFHPGMERLTGRADVLESWAHILRGRLTAPMRCDRPEVQLLASYAVVTCYEGNGDGPAHLAATNVFVLEDAEWRLVHHHAGPLRNPLPAPTSSSLN